MPFVTKFCQQAVKIINQGKHLPLKNIYFGQKFFSPFDIIVYEVNNNGVYKTLLSKGAHLKLTKDSNGFPFVSSVKFQRTTGREYVDNKFYRKKRHANLAFNNIKKEL